MKDKKLAVIVKESGLESTKAKVILEKFQDYFEVAAEWEEKAKTIVVTDENQLVDMKLARTGRLFLREKRTAIEKARKELKEQALREGKAIDGIANVLKALIVPIEEYLTKQEKFVEIRQGEKKEQERIEAEKKAEDDRIAAEKAEVVERERIRLENIRLKAEAEEREKKILQERKKVEKERKKQEETLQKQKEDAEKKRKEAVAESEAEQERIKEEAKLKQEKANQEAEEKLEKERKERKKVEAELKAKKDAEEEAKKKEQEAVEAKKKASDNEKLIDFANKLSSFTLPEVKSLSAKQTLSRVDAFLKECIKILNKGGKE